MEAETLREPVTVSVTIVGVLTEVTGVGDNVPSLLIHLVDCEHHLVVRVLCIVPMRLEAAQCVIDCLVVFAQVVEHVATLSVVGNHNPKPCVRQSRDTSPHAYSSRFVESQSILGKLADGFVKVHLEAARSFQYRNSHSSDVSVYIEVAYSHIEAETADHSGIPFRVHPLCEKVDNIEAFDSVGSCVLADVCCDFFAGDCARQTNGRNSWKVVDYGSVKFNCRKQMTTQKRRRSRKKCRLEQVELAEKNLIRYL